MTRSKTKDLRLARLIHKILDLGVSFHNSSVYHVLRANNEVENEANEATLLTAGALLKGEHAIWEPIP